MDILAFFILASCTYCPPEITNSAPQASISLVYQKPKPQSSNVVITDINTAVLLTKIQDLVSLGKYSPWEELTLSKNLTIGDQSSSLATIADRLLLLGDLSRRPKIATLFNHDLLNAVKLFQQRHGLKPDGIIGPHTLDWLNTSPQRRAELLAQNMLRQQRFFDKASNRYLLVNIPQFQLNLVLGKESVFQSKVIVGKAKRPTPIINGMLRSVVLNPTWNVPRSILAKDILRKIRSNNNFLLEHNYEVFDYMGNKIALEGQDWVSLANGKFPFNVRQKPGIKNTLGRVKFYFENEHSVYLHDTPNKQLFNRYQRTFSSGCIRVEKAKELSKWFANRQQISKRSWYHAFNNPSKNRWLPINSPMPIHLVYWTAWVDHNNQAQFRNDIYALEKRPYKTTQQQLTKLETNPAKFKF